MTCTTSTSTTTRKRSTTTAAPARNGRRRRTTSVASSVGDTDATTNSPTMTTDTLSNNNAIDTPTPSHDTTTAALPPQQQKEESTTRESRRSIQDRKNAVAAATNSSLDPTTDPPASALPQTTTPSHLPTTPTPTDTAITTPESKDTPATRTHQKYTIQFKLSAIDYAEKHSKPLAASKFQIPISLIFKWIKKKDILQNVDDKDCTRLPTLAAVTALERAREEALKKVQREAIERVMPLLAAPSSSDTLSSAYQSSCCSLLSEEPLSLTDLPTLYLPSTKIYHTFSSSLPTINPSHLTCSTSSQQLGSSTSCNTTTNNKRKHANDSNGGVPRKRGRPPKREVKPLVDLDVLESEVQEQIEALVFGFHQNPNSLACAAEPLEVADEEEESGFEEWIKEEPVEPPLAKKRKKTPLTPPLTPPLAPAPLLQKHANAEEEPVVCPLSPPSSASGEEMLEEVGEMFFGFSESDEERQATKTNRVTTRSSRRRKTTNKNDKENTHPPSTKSSKAFLPSPTLSPIDSPQRKPNRGVEEDDVDAFLLPPQVGYIMDEAPVLEEIFIMDHEENEREVIVSDLHELVLEMESQQQSLFTPGDLLVF
ncbi:hypothetical protein HDV05_001448 [Chytridiales sp. JEL 0842]|nr:hypothetical protein HDV05_001448 [Chytridiales sp. JEL 0842]